MKRISPRRGATLLVSAGTVPHENPIELKHLTGIQHLGPGLNEDEAKARCVQDVEDLSVLGLTFIARKERDFALDNLDPWEDFRCAG